MQGNSLPRGLNAQASAKVSFDNAARQAANAQAAAAEFSSNADNIDSGTINPDQLPIATTTSLGVVQPDGITVDVSPSGVISVPLDGTTIAVVATKVSVVYPRPCKVLTVATLPAGLSSPYNDGVFVSDSNATMTAGIGAVVAGGGVNKVPVYTTDGGASWRIG